MIYIRGRHPYAYRSGEWAHLFSIQHDAEGRDMWVVEFPDGATDVWPSWDAEADYDVRVQIEPPVEAHSDRQDNSSRSTTRDAAAAILAQVNQRHL